MKRKKSIIFTCGLVILLIAIYLLMPNGIYTSSAVPSEFQNEQFQHQFINGMTFIEHDGKTAYPITDDGTYLYVLNGAGYDFKKYSLDTEKKEIVIKKNIVNPNTRRDEQFQIVKIPYNDIKALIQSNKIKIRISYMYMAPQSTLIEYDFISKQSTIISNTLVGK